MELDKLKEAISNIKEFYGDALYSKDAGVVTKAVQELLSLASSVIAVSGILSVEDIRRIIIDKELVPKVCEDSGQAEWTVGESKKLAEAIHHRIAIALTGRFDVEKMAEVIWDFFYKGKIGFTEINKMAFGDVIKRLAHAIYEYFLGEGKG